MHCMFMVQLRIDMGLISIIVFDILQEFRKSHDTELLNTVAAQELKLVTYSKRSVSFKPF